MKKILSKCLIITTVLLMWVSTTCYALTSATKWSELTDSDFLSTNDSEQIQTLYTILIDNVSEKDVKEMTDKQLKSYIAKVKKYQEQYGTALAGIYEPNLAAQMQKNLQKRINAAKENTNASSSTKNDIKNTEEKKNTIDSNIDGNHKVVDETNGTNSYVEDKTQTQNPSTGVLGKADVSSSHTPDEVIKEGNDFVSKANGSIIDLSNLRSASNTLYNILLIIGIFLAIAIGMYLGIKFMLASAEDKAKVKEALIPYVAGCIVIFGAFAIWKLAVTLLSQI